MANPTEKEISDACNSADRDWMLDKLVNNGMWDVASKETCYHAGFDTGFKAAVEWLTKEAWLRRNPKALDSVMTGLAQAKAGEVIPSPDVAADLAEFEHVECEP